jgi:hypothetical protein
MLTYELAPLSIGSSTARFGERVVVSQKLPFPGKRGLERRMIGRPRILRSINKLRARFHREPLDLT